MTGLPSVVQALAKVMAAVQSVGKGSTNTQQGYRFRGIDAVVNAVGPAFREHGVICLPSVEDVSYQVVEVGKQRTLMRECTVRVRYTFHGPSGDTIECVSIGEAMDSGDKSTPKAMSVAYRVALLQALCIPTDEPEADSQSYERAAPRREPTWDPIEQENLVDAYMQELNACESADEISDIGRRVGAQKRAGELSPASVDRITVFAAACKAELNGGEGRGDSRAGEPPKVSPMPQEADGADRPA